jgi:hypothetical protein
MGSDFEIFDRVGKEFGEGTLRVCFREERVVDLGFGKSCM